MSDVNTHEGALLYLDKARREIESAEDLFSLKEIHSRLNAVKVFCKAARVSFEVTQRCSELKLRCEYRAGQLLDGREKPPPGPRSSKDRSHDATYPPRLEDLGITKSQSSRWQLIASIPQDEFDAKIHTLKSRSQEITSSEMLSFAKYLVRDRQRTERRDAATTEAEGVATDDHIRVLHGDFRHVLTTDALPEASAALVLTDPMYGRQFLPLWPDLARFAGSVLRPGRLLVAYSGQMHLPEILGALEEHLTYVWIGGVRCSYPNNIFPPRIKNSLKLLLFFSKSAYDPGPTRYWLHDLIDGDGYSDTKRDTELQQGVKEAEYLIESLTDPGDLVVDPFLGSGTVAVACKRLGRRFIGCDEDGEAVNLTRARLSEEVSTLHI